MQSFLQHLRAISQSSPHQSPGSDLTCRAQNTRSKQRASRLGRLVHLITAGALLVPQVLVQSPPVHADQAGICAVPGQNGSPSVNGIVNTYYPGTGTNVSVGSTSIPVGSINPNGNLTPIAAGDLLLIIQMQDADINSTNTDAYGDGTGGDVSTNLGVAPSPTAASGYTTLNNAGRYEYAVAAGPVSGGTVPIQNGTIYAYRTQAANSTQGQRTYQVVRIPQYLNATVTGTLTTAAQWNGSSGGIVALDVAQQLTFAAGSTVNVNGLGFRGGGSNPNGYSGGTVSPAPFRSISAGSLQGLHAPKGEGIAGTPRLVATQPFGSFNVRSSTSTADLGVSSYPNGDEGRGAPGNAGGGGNEHNSGGGGGANGGNGGLGGRSFNGFGASPPQFDSYVGGFGGKAVPADPRRLVLGGGGGAGDTNDQARPSGAGGGGGGIVIIRAGSITGSGTITARGADGIDSVFGTTPDAGGGGGAGGTVLVATATGNTAGLNVVATGGVGGNLSENNTTELDGPGAGGGGGAVYTTGGSAIDVTGGAAGLIIDAQLRNNTPNGATPGTSGIGAPVTISSDLTTSISGASCLVTVSGTVFDDADGSKVQNGSEVLSTATGLNAVLVDSTNKVVATTAVTSGAFSFSNVPANATYTVRITTNTATVGSAPPAVTLPSGWVSTGENLNGTADGTVDSIISVPVTTSNVTGVNLGIEQRPTAVGGTATSQTNPGGTSTVTVPSTLFTGSTDPDGTVASYKITAFPSNATSITINGTNYTSASFPGGGVTVTTAQLAGMVVDPVDGAVSVGISFKAIDNAGKESSNTATATLPFTMASGPALSSSSCPAGTTQTAGSLVTNGTFATLPANTSNPGNSRTNPGTFFPDANFYSQAANRGFDTYPNAGGGDNAFSIQEGFFGITGWGGNQVPFPGDPANNIPATTRWYYSNGNTFSGGEYLLWEQDVAGANLLQAGKTYTFYAYVTNVIEPTDNAGDDPIIRLRIDGTSGLPDGTVVTGPIRLLEGAATFDASDTTNIQVPTNNALPLNGWVRVGYTFTPSATTSSMKLKLTSAATGEWGDDFGLTAFGLSECVLSIQGTVWDDANGSANGTFTGIQNGSETGANASGLNAILVDAGGNVVATSTVAANGIYTLNGVSTNQAGLTIRLSTTAGTVGAAAPAASVPTGWIATSPLTTTAFNSGTTSLSGRDFGIERLPDTTALNPASQTNPGGTTTVQVPTLAGTDPEDGALGSGKSFKIVTLPTNGTLTYNGTAVTAGQTIANYNPALLLLDPNDGAITVSFTYAAVDAAGQVDPTPATVTMPFSSVANVLLIKRITAINGDRTQNPNDSTPLNVFVDDTTSSKAAEDNDSKWVTNYLKGAINAGKVKAGDTIEYTVYFLNAGNANANSVRICDRIRPNQIFQPNGYGVGTGVQVQMGTSSVINLTNANDGSDRTQFIAAGGAVPTNCNITAANTDGTLVVDITGAAATGNPALVTMPGATAAGSPNDSYGFFRFITQVNP
jgi:hypothetical protein